MFPLNQDIYGFLAVSILSSLFIFYYLPLRGRHLTNSEKQKKIMVAITIGLVLYFSLWPIRQLLPPPDSWMPHFVINVIEKRRQNALEYLKKQAIKIDEERSLKVINGKNKVKD